MRRIRRVLSAIRRRLLPRTLDEYLGPRGMDPSEGHIGQVPRQRRDLTRYICRPGVRRIMEIGFNAGHSSELFLRENAAVHVTSFDIGEYRYVRAAKEYLDRRFPARHLLVFGDSTQTVPSFEAESPFDLIFIDGGHSYEIAKADLLNCHRLAHEQTIVIVDDTVYTPELVRDFNIGPARAWEEMLSEGRVVELERREYCKGRGQSVGKYLFGRVLNRRSTSNAT